MKDIIKNNSKFIIVMLLVIVLGVVGVTVAIKVGNFNPIAINTTTGNISATISYDGSVNSSTVTSTGKMFPIKDSLVTGTSVTDARVLKVKFTVTGKSTNPANSIYDISLRNITMDKELKSLNVKWQLYKNNTLLSSGNFSPSFDVIENNRLVLTNTQQDLTTTASTYVFLMWISETCTGDITSCTNSDNQIKYVGKNFSFNIKLETSTKAKKTLTRTPAVIGDVNSDGEIDNFDLVVIRRHIAGKTTLNQQQLMNADINADGKVDEVDSKLLRGYVSDYFNTTLPNEPINYYTLYGDINEDGTITQDDINLLNEHLLGTSLLTTEQSIKNADINGDGTIDVFDKYILSKMIERGDEPSFTPVTE